MRLHAALVALAMTVAASASAAAQCMQDNQPDQIAEGTLSLGQFEDAGGGAPSRRLFSLCRCQRASAAARRTARSAARPPSTSTLSIAPYREVLESLIGRSVQVRGTPFSAHTAHHHAPIVMDVSWIDAI